MKKGAFILFSVMVGLMLLSGGCKSSLSYTLTFTTTLRDLAALDYQNTTLEELDSIVGEHVPVPTYLPEGFEVQEVYIAESPKGSKWVTPILISDEPIEWQDEEFKTKILYTIYWRSVAPKRPDLDTVSIGYDTAYVQEGDDTVMLFWWAHGILKELTATKQFSVKELAKIAGSVK